MEEGKNCKDVVRQLLAVRNAADKAIAQIVAENRERCILEEQASGRDTSKVVKEAIELLVRSRSYSRNNTEPRKRGSYCC